MGHRSLGLIVMKSPSHGLPDSLSHGLPESLSHGLPESLPHGIWKSIIKVYINAISIALLIKNSIADKN